MDSSEFNKQYSRLNKEQKAAVDTIEGPVFVRLTPREKITKYRKPFNAIVL